MRFSHGSLVYAALLFQGLYYVPQVRRSIASWRPTPETPGAEFILPPTSGGGLLASLFVSIEHILTFYQDLLMWTLLENYTHMDLARIGELNMDLSLSALELDPPVYSTTSPAELSYGRPLCAQPAIC
jgi:hypothetical protein